MDAPEPTPFMYSKCRCPMCGVFLGGPNGLNETSRRMLYAWPVCQECRTAFVNRRLGALCIDGALFALLCWVLHWLPPALPIAAFLLKDGFGGQSPGKWLLGLQVVDTRTHRGIGLGRSLARNLPPMVPLLLVLVLWPAPPGDPIEFDRPFALMGLALLTLLILGSQMTKGPRWGDRWASTKVTWIRYADHPPFDQRRMVCASCGYDLTGNVSRVCPECGRPLAEDQARMSKPE